MAEGEAEVALVEVVVEVQLAVEVVTAWGMDLPWRPVRGTWSKQRQVYMVNPNDSSDSPKVAEAE